jgi:pimeloyl-ACP methyl ester carboxylesterase
LTDTTAPPAAAATTAATSTWPVFERIDFTTSDGIKLNFRRLRPKDGTDPKGPVMMVHGAGMRWELFRAPIDPDEDVTLPVKLSEAGYDVWLLNWRASMDVPANQWTLDDAAVIDYPEAVTVMQSVLRRERRSSNGGNQKIKAIVHCQGSMAFMMSICAGKLGDVSLVIANSVGLHPIMPRPTWVKLPLAVNTLGRFIPYFNPQWGLHAPGFWPKVIDWTVRLTHHECDNPVCKHASFTYGFGFPAMWFHENLNDETHEWLKAQFGPVPISMFRQTADSVAAGRLVSTGKYACLPALLATEKPDTRARFVLMTGELNHTFSTQAMARTFEYFERHFPGRNTYQKFPGYGHMDVWVGKNAHKDVFPFIIDELNRPDE